MKSVSFARVTSSAAARTESRSCPDSKTYPQPVLDSYRSEAEMGAPSRHNQRGLSCQIRSSQTTQRASPTWNELHDEVIQFHRIRGELENVL
jgi:hypothetical protein